MRKYHGLAVLALISQPALAQDGGEAGRSGLRADIRIGYETPTLSYDGTTYKIGNSVSIGGEVGYDIPLSSSITWGPFVNYEFAKAQTCDAVICEGSNGNLAVGGRLGINVGRKAQIYGKLAYDRLQLSSSAPSLNWSAGKALNGGQIALGFDYNVSRHLYIGFEGDFAILQKFEGAKIRRRHVAVTGGARF